MIAIICPSEDEMNPIREVMIVEKEITIALLKILKGRIHNREVLLLYSGVCKVNAAIAAQLVIDKYDPQMIILSGVAGSLNMEIEIFDTIIATEIAHHDVDEKVLTEYHPWMTTIWFPQRKDIVEKCMEIESIINVKFKFGKIVSGEKFIEKEEKQKIFEKYHAIAVDMESASIAQVCHANNVPLLTVRTITDVCDEMGKENFENNVSRSSILSSKVVIEYLKRFG